MSKTAKKTRAASPITSLTLLAAVFKGHDPDVFSPLIPLADAELAAVTADGFASSTVWDATKRIAVARDPRLAKSLRLVNGLQKTERDRDTNDAIGEVQWTQAEAGFALGLVVGLRIGGAR